MVILIHDMLFRVIILLFILLSGTALAESDVKFTKHNYENYINNNQTTVTNYNGLHGLLISKLSGAYYRVRNKYIQNLWSFDSTKNCMFAEQSLIDKELNWDLINRNGVNLTNKIDYDLVDYLSPEYGGKTIFFQNIGKETIILNYYGVKLTNIGRFYVIEKNTNQDYNISTSNENIKIGYRSGVSIRTDVDYLQTAITVETQFKIAFLMYGKECINITVLISDTQGYNYNIALLTITVDFVFF